MKIRKQIIFLLSLLFGFTSLISCGEPDFSINSDINVESGLTSDSTGEPSSNFEESSDNFIDVLNPKHYLVFEVEGIEIARIIVLESDTYDSLKPFFPTIPEKEGYVAQWQEIDSVYSDIEMYISIVAYYTKK